MPNQTGPQHESDARRPALRLGRVVATPGALAALERSGQTANEFLARHVRGDWGDLCAEDKRLNDEAVAHEEDPDLRTRVLSAYSTARGDRLWVITEADRSTSVLLLPEEY
jgi:hypothetical protein